MSNWVILSQCIMDECLLFHVFLFVCLMVFNATFNNIWVISWLSVLLLEETGGPWENHRPVASHWQTLLSHNVVHLALIEIRTHNIRSGQFYSYIMATSDFSMRWGRSLISTARIKHSYMDCFYSVSALKHQYTYRPVAHLRYTIMTQANQ